MPPDLLTNPTEPGLYSLQRSSVSTDQVRLHVCWCRKAERPQPAVASEVLTARSRLELRSLAGDDVVQGASSVPDPEGACLAHGRTHSQSISTPSRLWWHGCARQEHAAHVHPRHCKAYLHAAHRGRAKNDLVVLQQKHVGEAGAAGCAESWSARAHMVAAPQRPAARRQSWSWCLAQGRPPQ